MSGFPILSLMILLPIAAAAICLFLSDQGARWVALATTALLFVLGILLWVNYEIGGPQWQFVENAPIFGRFAWALGIDGIALMLIMLSVFLMRHRVHGDGDRSRRDPSGIQHQQMRRSGREILLRAGL